MKTAAKVFIVLGMISGFWMIFPLIVGGIALNKLKNASEKKEITVMAVITLIFCSPIGGILMLCINESEFAPEIKTKSYQIRNNYDAVSTNNFVRTASNTETNSHNKFEDHYLIKRAIDNSTDNFVNYIHNHKVSYAEKEIKAKYGIRVSKTEIGYGMFSYYPTEFFSPDVRLNFFDEHLKDLESGEDRKAAATAIANGIVSKMKSIMPKDHSIKTIVFDRYNGDDRYEYDPYFEIHLIYTARNENFEEKKDW